MNESPPSPNHLTDGQIAYLMNGGGDIFMLADAACSRFFVSAAVTDVLGLQPSAIEGDHLDYVHPDFRDGMLECWKESLAHPGELYTYEFLHARADGSFRWLEGRLRNMLHDASVNAMVINLKDISRRKEAEAQKEQSIQQYRFLADHISDVIWECDLNFKHSFISASIERFQGYSPEEFMALTFDQSLSAQSLAYASERLSAEIAEVMRNPQAYRTVTFTAELEYIHKEGYAAWGEVTYSYRISDDGQVLGLYGVTRDITERKLAQDALRESEERFRMLINALPDIICLKDGAGRWIIANEYDLNLFELSGVEYRGKTDCELAEFSPFYRDAFLNCGDTDEEAWKAGGITRKDEIIPRPDGSALIFDVVKIPTWNPDGSRKGLVVLGRDITERRRMQEKLVEAQKMDSIGNLAGGVAHDFNNMLGGIVGYASLLETLETDARKRTYIEGIMNAAERAGGLTQKLLAFGRRGKNRSSAVSLNEIGGEVIEILRHTIPKTITVTTAFAADARLIDGDPSQLNQVIMNLCVNAKDAMQDGGELYIGTENCIFDRESAERFPGMHPGAYTAITVRDTGTGIPDEVREHMYEPFYTTKQGSSASGTGLGLSVVYGIVTNHQGFISLETAPGRGSAFTLYFPSSARSAPAERAVQLAVAGGAGASRILLAEDDDLVRVMLVSMLEALGYNVVATENGRQCVDWYVEHGNSVDLVILDMIMPVLGGAETFAEIRRINPAQRVLLSTGYGRNNDVQRLLDAGAAGMIGKPYRLEELARTVGTVLAEK